MPGAVSGWGLEVVRVRDALGQCDIAVLPCQREVMPHLDESQYVPLPRILRLPSAVGGKILAPLQHVLRRLLEVAVALRLHMTHIGHTGLLGAPRADNGWGQRQAGGQPSGSTLRGG